MLYRKIYIIFKSLYKEGVFKLRRFFNFQCYQKNWKVLIKCVNTFITAMNNWTEQTEEQNFSWGNNKPFKYMTTDQNYSLQWILFKNLWHNKFVYSFIINPSSLQSSVQTLARSAFRTVRLPFARIVHGFSPGTWLSCFFPLMMLSFTNGQMKQGVI